MAIGISSEEKLDEFGITVSNFVVSINGRYEVYRQRNRGPNSEPLPNTFMIITYMCFYTQQGYDTQKKPFVENQQFTMEVTREHVKGNVFRLIYNKIKERFTTTTDLDD
jgi:hypothetical protein